MKKNKDSPLYRFGHLAIIFLTKFLIVIFLPLHLFIFKVIKSEDKLKTKILKSLGIFFFVFPFSFIVDLIILVIFLTVFYWAGIIKSPVEVIGQSMMPTLTDHQYLYMHPYPYVNWAFWKPKLNRGDIITFQDSKTGDKSYIKRVLGLPGDQLEIRNGFIYVNGKVMDESYISKYRSTYGGTFLSECKKVRIPPDNVFVLGDNRIRSSDSREIGYVPISDIDTVLYYSEQNFFNKKPIKESNASVNGILLNINDYVVLINKFRQEKKLKPLQLNPQLSKSAELRADAMLKFDDLSWEATKSAYPMSRSMTEANYYNIVYNEYPILGYYDANDLYNYMMEVINVENFLLNKDYQDIGIATVMGDLNNCPVQLVVQQIAGYVPPNYSAEDIQGWEFVINDLNKVIPTWEKSRGWRNINQDDLNKLIELLYRRKNNAEAIYYRMKANQWLTNAENRMVDEDKNIYDQIEILANKLNGK